MGNHRYQLGKLSDISLGSPNRKRAWGWAASDGSPDWDCTTETLRLEHIINRRSKIREEIRVVEEIVTTPPRFIG